jgi:hypothetical protein
MFTTIPHHMSIGKLLLLYFKPIHKKVNFISEILKFVVHKFENHVGVLFIKRDGVGSTMILVTLF